MQHTLMVPGVGQTTNEVTVVKWLKQPGEKIKAGEPVVEVENDKATLEIESYAGGYLREWLVQEGTTVPVLSPIAVITDTAEEPYAPIVSSAAQPTPDARKRRVRSGKSSVAARRSPQPAGAARAPGSTVLTNELKLGLYRQMVRCRAFEERVNLLFLQGKIPGTVHQAQGQEACAVGVCAALGAGDMITSTHRPHEHAVARGIPVRSLMAELFAKKDGCCAGKGGSMHLGDPDRGMLPAIAIVGGGIPIATGYALAFKYLNKSHIVACFFGDGAVNIGSFHEAINMAAVWGLPVVLVCENNRYGASTAIEKVIKIKQISDRASAYGIPGKTVDGNDVEAVYAAMVEAATRARGGGGPTLLELETYRLAGHSRSDPGHYRPKIEVEAWKQRDPIVRFEESCLASGLLSPMLIQEIRESAERELDEAVDFAEQSPSPSAEDCLTDVYAD